MFGQRRVWQILNYIHRYFAFIKKIAIILPKLNSDNLQTLINNIRLNIQIASQQSALSKLFKAAVLQIYPYYITFHIIFGLDKIKFTKSKFTLTISHPQEGLGKPQTLLYFHILLIQLGKVSCLEGLKSKNISQCQSYGYCNMFPK